jgi:hypothetical protein
MKIGADSLLIAQLLLVPPSITGASQYNHEQVNDIVLVSTETGGVPLSELRFAPSQGLLPESAIQITNTVGARVPFFIFSLELGRKWTRVFLRPSETVVLHTPTFWAAIHVREDRNSSSESAVSEPEFDPQAIDTDVATVGSYIVRKVVPGNRYLLCVRQTSGSYFLERDDEGFCP